MMKRYKPAYGFTLFLSYSYLFILVIVGMIPLFIFMYKEVFWIGCIGILLLFCGFFFILFLIINLISRCFTKYSISVDDTTIYYGSNFIDFNDIREIGYDCGEIGKHGSTPHSVIIIGKKHGYIHIERPSIMFLFKLISKCGHKFKINHIKRIIFLWPSLALLGGIILYLSIIFSK